MGALWGILTMPTLAQASTGDVGIIIEIFVVRQFPNAVGHYWVINETLWDGDEMIVDVQRSSPRAISCCSSWQNSSEESSVSR